MPARDSYYVDMSVNGEYEGLLWEHSHEVYLSPGQDHAVAMANVLRSAALELASEEGDSRTDVAIYAALDALRAKYLRPGDFPNTRLVLLAQLWELAEALGLDWYGVR